MDRLLKVISSVILIFLTISNAKTEQCTNRQADVIFALDASTSVWGPDFKRQVNFVKNVVKSFEVGFTAMRFGVITYSNLATTELELYSQRRQSGILRALDLIQQARGDSSTYLALRRVREMFLFSGRNAVPKIVVLFTDGQSTDTALTKLEAQYLRDGNILTFVVGIGDDVNADEMKNIATDSDHRLTVDDFVGLKKIRELLVDKICEDALPGVDKFGGITFNVPSRTKPVLGCGGKPADVIFAIDASNSITRTDFRRLLEFASTMAGTFEIGHNRTRVGALTFADYAKHQFGLNYHKSSNDVITALRGIEQTGGTFTDTANGLRLLRRMFSTRRGSRAEVPHIAIVITDGRSDNAVRTARAAAKLHQQGIHIFGIGVGEDIDQEELRKIASDPDESYLFTVETYNALNTLASVLEVKKCEAFKTTTTTTTTTTTPTTPTTTPTTKMTTPTTPTTKATTPTTKATTPTTKATTPPTKITTPTTKATTPTTKATTPTTKATTPTTKATTPTTKATTESETEVVEEVHEQESNEKQGVTFEVAPEDNKGSTVILVPEGGVSDNNEVENRILPNHLPRESVLEANSKTVIITPKKVMETTEEETIEHSRVEGRGKTEMKTQKEGTEGDNLPNFDINGGSAAEGKGKTEIKTPQKTRIIPSSLSRMQMSGDQAGCGLKRPADVVFAMPGSASPDDTNKSLRFLRTLTSKFKISTSQVRVGFVPKDCHELPGFRLDDFDSPDEVDRRLLALEYRRPNTAMSLHYMRTMSFKPCHGSRPEAKKIGVVILDDASYNLKETIVEARKAKEEHDIEMFVIAIGKTITQKEIDSVASERTDDHQIRISGYDDLPEVVESMAKLVNFSCLGLI